MRAACLKGGPNDLRSLLVGNETLDPAGFDATQARALDLGIDVQQILAREAGLDADRLDALMREAADHCPAVPGGHLIRRISKLRHCCVPVA